MKNFGRMLATAMIALILVSLLPWQAAYAHSFSGDESASFLSLVHKIRVESQLAADNASDPELGPYHASIASESLTPEVIDEIAERNERIARDLPAAVEDLRNAVSSKSVRDNVSSLVSTIDSLLSEAVSARLDRAQVNNSTIQAVVLADAIDEVLRNYGEAVGAEMDLTDMSLMEGMSDSGASGGSGHNMSGHGNETTTDPGAGGGEEILNIGAYQSAQGWAQESLEIFQDDLRPLGVAESNDAESDRSASVSKIGDTLVRLEDTVNNKSAPEELMRIVHLEIHPGMMIAYNLQVIPEFPLPLLLIAPVLAATIVLSRFKTRMARSA